MSEENALTYKTGLSGPKHSNWTIFIIVPVSSAPSWKAGWHVEIGADISACTTRQQNQIFKFKVINA